MFAVLSKSKLKMILINVIKSTVLGMIDYGGRIERRRIECGRVNGGVMSSDVVMYFYSSTMCLLPQVPSTRVRVQRFGSRLTASNHLFTELTIAHDVYTYLSFFHFKWRSVKVKTFVKTGIFSVFLIY